MSAAEALDSSLTVRVEELPPTEWDAFVDEHPAGTPYHTSAWSEAVARGLGHRPTLLVARRGDALAGILPLFRVAPPWRRASLVCPAAGNHAGPLGVDARIEDSLVEEAIRQVRAGGFDHLEIRSRFPLRFPDLVTSGRYVTFLKALDEPAARLFARLAKRVRHAVRKASSRGLALSVGRGPREIDDFMRCYRDSMDHLGSPPFGESFFAALAQAFGERLMIVVAREGARAVGADFLISSRRVAMPIFGGLTAVGRELGANYAITWRSIEEAIDRGHGVYDLGRSSPGTGSASFKSKWGAVEVPLHYSFLMAGGGEPPDRDPRDPRFLLASRAWRWLPRAVRWSLGPRLVKYLL